MLRHPVSVMVSSLLLFILFPNVTGAGASNATSPAPREGWTPPPRRRGTIDILWSCFSTLFICIWGSLHLNVPGRSESSAAILRRKLKYCLLSAVAPEFLVLEAARQFAIAWWHSIDMQLRGHDYWTCTHSFVALMGGIADQGSHGIVELDEIWKVSKTNLSVLSLKVVRDKSKSSNMVKTIACFQVGWSIIQCAGRRIQGLPISPLEIATLAYAANSFLLYGLWWKKPLDIGVPFEIVSDGVGTTLMRTGDFNFQIYTPLYPFAGLKEHIKKTKFGALKAYMLGPEGDSSNAAMILAAASNTVFGIIHLAAWNSNFATPIEKLLWRICASVMAGLPFLVLLAVFLAYSLSKHTAAFITIFLSLFYFASRIYLMVEPFISLRSLPAGSYDTVQWANYFPHI